MRYKEMNTNVDLRSGYWLRQDEDGATRPFLSAGFSNTEQIMELRVFDLLNILGVDRIMAEEMMYALYRFFNGNRHADDALYRGIIEQYFDLVEWRQLHPDASKVLVKDIIMPVGMNIDALIELFDGVARRFWKSEEYNSREYRYWGYKDLMEQKEKGEEK